MLLVLKLERINYIAFLLGLFLAYGPAVFSYYLTLNWSLNYRFNEEDFTLKSYIALLQGMQIWKKKIQLLPKLKSLMSESQEHGLKPWAYQEGYFHPQNLPLSKIRSMLFAQSSKEQHQMRTKLLQLPLLAYSIREGQCLGM